MSTLRLQHNSNKITDVECFILVQSHISACQNERVYVNFVKTSLMKCVAYQHKATFLSFRIHWNYVDCVNGWRVNLIQRSRVEQKLQVLKGKYICWCLFHTIRSETWKISPLGKFQPQTLSLSNKWDNSHELMREMHNWS